MIVGVFRNSFPRVDLRVPGVERDLDVEFIVDSGFEGEMALPPTLVRQIDCEPGISDLFAFADGTKLRCPVYSFDLLWNGESRKTQVVVLENNPLVGVSLLDGCRLEMEFVEGADVVIEFP